MSLIKVLLYFLNKCCKFKYHIVFQIVVFNLKLKILFCLCEKYSDKSI